MVKNSKLIVQVGTRYFCLFHSIEAISVIHQVQLLIQCVSEALLLEYRDRQEMNHPHSTEDTGVPHMVSWYGALLNRVTILALHLPGEIILHFCLSLDYVLSHGRMTCKEAMTQLR